MSMRYIGLGMEEMVPVGMYCLFLCSKPGLYECYWWHFNKTLKIAKGVTVKLKSIQLQMDSIKSMSYFSKITNIKNISNIEIYFQYSCIHILTMILLNKAMICNGATLFRKHSYLGSILSIVKLLIILFCTRWNYKTTKWMVSVCLI